MGQTSHPEYCYTHLVEYRRQAEDNDGDGPLVVYNELPEGGVVVANRLLDFANRLVHLC